MEEFGIARDGASYDPISTTHIRDKYYQFIFDYLLSSVKSKKNNLVAINFWAYGGSGRPSVNGGWWKPGDDFTGDPPHERQGWYSVYDKDTTLTVAEMSIKKLNLISKYLVKMKRKSRI